MGIDEKNNNYSPADVAEDNTPSALTSELSDASKAELQSDLNMPSAITTELSDASKAELQVEENKIKIISPGRMVLKRFFRSRLSVIGLVTLIVLFSFSLFGPIFTGWGEAEADMRIAPAEPMDFNSEYTEIIRDPLSIEEIARQHLDNFTAFKRDDKGNVIENNEDITKGAFNYSKALYEKYKDTENEVQSFTYQGETLYFEIVFNQNKYTIYHMQADVVTDPNTGTQITNYSRILTQVVKRTSSTKILNLNDVPTSDHWLGTDASAYDILTRLMYGGRISLTLGFVVVFIAAFIGIVMGGIAGYFGKWADLIIMRIIDLIYCLPGLPILLIFSAILDGMNIDEGIRIYFLMGVLSLLGWAGTARLVRGQILTLREQEFMVAAEALGISVPRRIIKHLVPNIMPLLIVSMTLSLGGTIISESTLSFLGLGIRAPKAAWGTMIGAADDPVVLQYYPNQWVPAGVMIVLAVLAFNFVGDGLRDAFDPKMKR